MPNDHQKRVASCEVAAVDGGEIAAEIVANMLESPTLLMVG